jgi:hypothetical protein
MRTTLMMALLTLTAAPVAVAAAAPTAHTRPLTPSTVALLADAAERSLIVRTLLQGLEQTDIVVYLSDSMSESAGQPSACVGFLSRAAGTRYLLVRIDRWRLSPTDRIALLGHELQHAAEIAAAPDVQDGAALGRLYQHIGWESRRGQFETSDARLIGRRIKDELAGHEAPR